MSGEGVIAAAGRALGRDVARARRVAGGDINEAWQLDLGDGYAFLKTRPDAPAGEFEAEAAGLAWLAEPAGIDVPDVLAVVAEEGCRGLILEWVDPGRLDEGGEEDLGRGLAIIHRAGAPSFDAVAPGSPRRGSLRFGAAEVPLGGVPTGSGWGAHYGRRLEHLAGAALDAGRIDADTAVAVGRVVVRIDELAGPDEPPARIHGDLWSGNVHAGPDGRPRLIDPAAHGAHRELDLAMLNLFGSVSRRTLAAYEDVWPPAEGHEERVALWQLQPLLVHAILFGGGYGVAVGRTARLYV